MWVGLEELQLALYLSRRQVLNRFDVNQQNPRFPVYAIQCILVAYIPRRILIV